MTAHDAPRAREVTPFRVLSLWFALSLPLGGLVQLALDPVLASGYRTIAGVAVPFVAAVLALRRWPGLDTHVAWRVTYGSLVGFWLLAMNEILGVASHGAVTLDAFGDRVVAIPLGVAFGVLVEWYRHHRGA